MKRKLLIAAAVLLAAGLAAWAFWPKPWVPYDLSGMTRCTINGYRNDQPYTFSVTDPAELDRLKEDLSGLRLEPGQRDRAPAGRWSFHFTDENADGVFIQIARKSGWVHHGGRDDWYWIAGGQVDWDHLDRLAEAYAARQREESRKKLESLSGAASVYMEAYTVRGLLIAFEITDPEEVRRVVDHVQHPEQSGSAAGGAGDPQPPGHRLTFFDAAGRQLGAFNLTYERSQGYLMELAQREAAKYPVPYDLSVERK